MTATRYETLSAAAGRLGIHPKTLRRRIADGQLTAYKVGQLIRLDPAEVDALLRPIPTAAAALASVTVRAAKKSVA